MAKPVNKGPYMKLKGEVAQPRELREMSRSELRARTCKVCGMTYRSGSSVARCGKWHRGEVR